MRTTTLNIIRRSYHVSLTANKNGSSSTDWLKRQQKDPYVRKCKEDGYRARSAYKLLEMNEKFDGELLMGPGTDILECGAAPGAWTQVAAEFVNAGGNYKKKENAGMVVGCDLLNIEPVPGANLFSQCDFTLEENQKQILKVCPCFNVILSDMAPNASGHKDMDQDRIILLSYSVLRFALFNSYKGSNFVTKVWEGPKVDNLLLDLKKYYNKVQKVKPKSSRKESGEIYLVAREFKGIMQKVLSY